MQAQSGDMQCPSPHIASFSTTEEVYSIILERERQYNQTFLTCASFINGLEIGGNWTEIRRSKNIHKMDEKWL